MNASSRCYLKGIALVGGLLLGSLSQAFAQAGGDKPAKTAPESFVFEMRAKPWMGVFEFLTDKTGRPFISTDAPPGTFNFIGPQGRKYTIPQIIDIINDGLLKEKWVLLNRGTSFTLVPADEKIDPALLPRINISELEEHGLTEIVSTVYQCKSLVAEDTGPEVKKQMGPFGDIIILHKANQLLYCKDTVGNLLHASRRSSTARGENEDQAETYSHRCIYIRKPPTRKPPLQEISWGTKITESRIVAFSPQRGGPTAAAAAAVAAAKAGTSAARVE